MRRNTLTLVLLLGTLFPPCARAQGAGERGLFFDTVDVDVVNVEVIVTDKEGNPVTGLGRDDFEVYEDGRRVELTNFFAVENRQAVLPGAEPGPETPPELLPAPETERLNLVVFVDNLNLRPQSRNVIFDDLRRYLEERVDPRDRVMLVTMDDTIEVAQPFTNDASELLATLERLGGETGRHVQLEMEHRRLLRDLERGSLAPPSELNRNFDQAKGDAERLAGSLRRFAEQRYSRVQATVEALQRFTDSLAGMRGRKALLYVSDGIHLRPAESLGQSWVNKYEEWVFEHNDADLMRALRDMMQLTSSPELDTQRHFEELVEHASGNRVAFYPLSMGGHLRGGYVSAEWSGGGTSSGRGPLAPEVIAAENTSLQQSLLQIADGTGGIAFTSTANISGLLERMVRDFESFYSLGFRPPGERAEGEVHEVEVKVRGEGLRVRHRTAHRERDPLDHLRALTLSALHYGIADNPLEVALEAGAAEPAGKKRYRVPVMIKVPFEKLLLLPQAEHHMGKVSVFVVVRDVASGGVSEPRRIDLPIEIPNERILQVLGGTAAYPLQLELERGPKRIAVGLRDHLGRTDSTLALELDVEPGAGSAAAVVTSAGS